MPLKIPKIITIAVLVFTLWILLFGVSQIGMDMSTMDGKANCPFGGHSMAICQMNPMEHIQKWQSMFTTLPAKDSLSFLSALLALLALLALRSWKKLPIFDRPRLESYVNYFYVHNVPIFDALKEAFSRGILNPKIF